MEHLSAFFEALVAHFGYLGLFVVMTLANIGIPAGAEVVMPTAGALAGTGHLPPIGPVPGWFAVGLIGTLGELLGGTILYLVGWYGGLPFVHRYGRLIRFREHELERVQQFYARHGRSTVFWCRFVPFIRGVSALPPGLSRMRKRWFYTYTALGSAIFCFGLSALGSAAGRNIGTIVATVHDFALAIIGAVVVLLAAVILWWRKRRAVAPAAATVSSKP